MQSLISNLQAQDRLISLIGESVLAGYSMTQNGQARFLRVTPEGLIEYEEYEGPKLVKKVEQTEGT